MTSTNQTSSGDKANLVSSSPELLTRPASKPDDRSDSITGELRTGSANQLPSSWGRRLGEACFYSIFEIRLSTFTKPLISLREINFPS
jgi:hypothetical protein